eukprot:scaffold109317_cov24-Phaeocystis_antarctica.AAC.1
MPACGGGAAAAAAALPAPAAPAAPLMSMDVKALAARIAARTGSKVVAEETARVPSGGDGGGSGGGGSGGGGSGGGGSGGGGG